MGVRAINWAVQSNGVVALVMFPFLRHLLQHFFLRGICQTAQPSSLLVQVMFFLWPLKWEVSHTSVNDDAEASRGQCKG